MAYHDLFKSITVAEIPGTSQVLVLNSALTVDAALEQLVLHHYSSAPVQDHESGEWLGFFDISDMIKYVVDTLHRTSDPSVEFSVADDADLRDILAVASKVLPGGFGSLKDLCKSTVFRSVHSNTTLMQLLEILGTKGVRRVPVIDPQTNQITKLITQSNLAKYFIEHPSLCSFLKDRTFESTKVGYKPVHCVSSEAPALRAFELLIKFDVNAIGIIDSETGELVTTFTAGDIRILTSKTKFKFFGASVLDIINQSRQQFDGPHARPALISLHPSDSLWEALSKMAKAHIHRVFLVNQDHKAAGIVTFKELLQYIREAVTAHL